MNHPELMSHLKAHLGASQRHNERLAKVHGEMAECLKVADPKLSGLHERLSDLYQIHTEHLGQVIGGFGADVEPSLKGEGASDDLNTLAKVLGN
jgi:hypothetical protein